LFLKRLRDEAGYSLIEVMASIMILAIAIIPMAGMFEMGLRSATAGSNYDKARALANLKMEEAKNLSFADVENDFPEAGNPTPYDEPSAWLSEANFTNLEYRIVKEYIDPPPTGSLDPPDPVDPSGEADFEPSDEPTHLIRITVIVQWGDGNEYRTFGLVSA
jgi:prepilin-type N-terminal cleavage/methylation domain-containing protein